MSYTKTHANNTNTIVDSHKSRDSAIIVDSHKDRVSTAQVDRPSKNLWCRDTYREYIVKVLGKNPFIAGFKASIRSCPYSSSECRGAHSPEELVMLPHIYGYNKIVKSKYDWVKLYLALVETLQNDIVKVLNPEHISLIRESLNQNFIVILQVWRNMACNYRRLKKELPKRSSVIGKPDIHSSGYSFSEEIPEFNLIETLENVAWSLVRLTRICPIRKTFDDKISSNKKVTIMEMCLATGINCKEGIHLKSEMLCTDDFLTGSCKCVPKEELEVKEVEYLTEIITLSNQLTTLSKSTSEFSKGKCTPQEAIKKRIAYLEKLTAELYYDRMIHYTEEDMEPFDRQYSNYIAQEDKKKKDKEEKEVWNHHLIDTTTEVKKVVKIVKPGMKKA
jgi:hypothetical protein